MLSDAAINGKLTVEIVAEAFGWKYMKVYNNKGILAKIAKEDGLRFATKAEMRESETFEDIMEKRKRRAKLMSEIYYATEDIDGKAKKAMARSMGATSQEVALFAALEYCFEDYERGGVLWTLGLDSKGEPLKDKEKKE